MSKLVGMRFGWLALLAGFIVRPTTTVRQTDRLGMMASWLVHAAGLAVAAVVWPMISETASGSYAGVIFSLSTSGQQMLAHIGISIAQPLIQSIAGIVSHVLAEEAFFIVAAWGLMAFASQPEPEVASFERTLRRLWRLTPHLMLCLIALTLAWQRAPLYTLNAPNTHDWFAAGLVAALFTLSVIWPMSVILLTTRPPTWRSQCRWPAHCESCGYSLLGLPHDDTCPECGKAIATSLTGARTISQDRVTDWPYARLAAFAIRQPTALGGMLRLLEPLPQPLRFLSLTLGWIFVLALVGAAASLLLLPQIAQYWIPPFTASSPLPWLAAFVVGLSAAALALVVTLGLASTLGSILTVHTRRPLLRAGLLAACYLSPCLIPWLIIDWLTSSVLLVAAARQWFAASYLRVSASDWIFLAINAPCLAGYLLPTARLAAAMRHANH